VEFTNGIQSILIYALPVLFAITVHEAAHGYVARRLGDNTAYLLGRVTLNPIKHIDPIGTIAMPLLLLFTTAALPGGPYVLGYAKPVPVNFAQLRHPKRDMVWVAAAGPVVNYAQALVWGIVLVLLAAFGVQERFFHAMAVAGVQVNIILAVFNLFPMPPLDGGRVLVGLLPDGPAYQLARLERFGFFIVIALLIAGVLTDWWLAPLFSASAAVLNAILLPLLHLVR
jgi:Zn-dependent protease